MGLIRTNVSSGKGMRGPVTQAFKLHLFMISIDKIKILTCYGPPCRKSTTQRSKLNTTHNCKPSRPECSNNYNERDIIHPGRNMFVGQMFLTFGMCPNHSFHFGSVVYEQMLYFNNHKKWYFTVYHILRYCLSG